MNGRGRKILAERAWDEPHPSRLSPEHPSRTEILDAHAAAVRGNDPGYLDPASRLFVLTSAFLTKRGFCCGRGCRHCPYLE